MILVLDPAAGEREVRAVLARLEALGLAGRVVRLGERPFVHVTDGPTSRAKHLLAEGLVQAIVPTSGPRVRREGRRFHPYHSLRIGAGLTLLVGGLFVLAGAFPHGVGAVPLPGQPPAALDAWPWYLRPFRAVTAMLPAEPAWLGPLVLVLLVLGVLALPLLDRSRGSGPAARAPVWLLGLVLVALAVGGILWGGRP